MFSHIIILYEFFMQNTELYILTVKYDFPGEITQI